MCWGMKPAAGKCVGVLHKFVCMEGGTVKNDAALIDGNGELHLNRSHRSTVLGFPGLQTRRHAEQKGKTDPGVCMFNDMLFRNVRHSQRLNGERSIQLFPFLRP